MIRWFTGHPTAGNLLLIAGSLPRAPFAAAGLLRETFPDFRAGRAEITVPLSRLLLAEDVVGPQNNMRAALGTRCKVSRGSKPSLATAQDRTRGAPWQTMAPGNDALRFVNSLRTEGFRPSTPSLDRGRSCRGARAAPLRTPSHQSPSRATCRWASWIFTPTPCRTAWTALAGVARRNARDGGGPRHADAFHHTPLSPCSTAHRADTRRLAAAIAAQNIDLPRWHFGGAGRGT